MGYTQYFPQSRDFTDQEWKSIKTEVRKILKHCSDKGIVLKFEYDEDKEPCIDNKMIRFNGDNDLGHETFLVKKIMSHNAWEDPKQPAFQFCKTARKPYDLAVCLSLLRIQAVAPNVLRISSDGGEKEWTPIFQVYEKLFDEQPPSIM